MRRCLQVELALAEQGVTEVPFGKGLKPGCQAAGLGFRVYGKPLRVQ